MTTGTIKAKLKEIADNNNLAFDHESMMVFGNFGGYNIAITKNSNPDVFHIHLNLEMQNTNVTQVMFNDIKAVTQKITSAKVGNNGNVVVETASAVTVKGLYENLQKALNSLVPYLNSKGVTNSCYLCNSKETYFYGFNGTAFHMCENCASKFAQTLEEKQSEYKAKKENVVFGIVGALLGSLIGVAAIVIIGQLGYVAAISGFLLAVCTIKGYEMFAGKTSKIGILICLAIMILMTFVGNRLDWAIFAMRELGMDIFDAYIAVPQLADPDAYRTNLIMIALFALIGSVSAVISAFKSQGTMPTLKKLQHYASMGM